MKRDAVKRIFTQFSESEGVKQVLSDEFAVGADGAGPLGWAVVADAVTRTLVVLRIADYPAVRREVGLRRAAGIGSWLASAAQMTCPVAKIEVAARDRIEMWIDGVIAGSIDDMVSQIAELLSEEGALNPIALDSAVLTGGPDDDDLELIERAEHQLASVVHDHDPAHGQTAAGTTGRSLVQQLPAALARGELFVVYQPKIHLRRQEVAGLEALIRWRHPVRGLIPPSEFIPEAERSGEIAGLTLWTLSQVIHDQRVVAAAGHDIPIFINIAGRLLSDTAFVRDACELIGEGSSRLGFEITETSVIRDPEGAIANLKTLAAAGLTIAIDDYGAGLSSLAYLKQLPARELKIDKLFVTQLTSSNRDPLIVRSTIDLAHALDMQVVAEGVESQAALALLAVMGCDMVQGYLISRPQPLAETLAYLAADRHVEVNGADLAPRPTAVRAAR